MAQSPAGKWVSYEDYARLKADLRNCHTAIRVKEEEKDRLKAEVERLTDLITRGASTPDAKPHD